VNSLASQSVTERLGDVIDLLRHVRADWIEVLTVTHERVTLQPWHLDDGENIARALGLDNAIDQRMLEPGYTLWTGTWRGIEVQVRGTLRTAGPVI
jgi:predicted nucleic acid-binding protein